MAEVLTAAGAFRDPEPGPGGAGGVDWVEHLRSRHLSVGTYSLSVGARDDQVPHDEDEIYVITAGEAVFTCGPIDERGGGAADSASNPVRAGSVVFVPAGEEHRFVNITTDLAALVIFAPPETEPDPATP